MSAGLYNPVQLVKMIPTFCITIICCTHVLSIFANKFYVTPGSMFFLKHLWTQLRCSDILVPPIKVAYLKNRYWDSRAESEEHKHAGFETFLSHYSWTYFCLFQLQPWFNASKTESAGGSSSSDSTIEVFWAPHHPILDVYVFKLMATSTGWRRTETQATFIDYFFKNPSYSTWAFMDQKPLPICTSVKKKINYI